MQQVVKITFEDLKPFPKQSLSAWCRWAIGEGYNPNARVEVYRDLDKPWEIAGKCIADVSKLTVIEDATKGPYFAEYVPFPTNRRVFPGPR
jgi:hypothetical protein